jgi:hypothetical protein
MDCQSSVRMRHSKKYMEGSEDAASNNNAYVFRNVRNAIDEEQVKTRLPALPETGSADRWSKMF